MISYWIFLALSVTLFSTLALPSKGTGDISPAPLGLVFVFAWVWQLFTLYHNNHHFVTWLLTILYSIPTFFFIIALLWTVL